jgi:hypothetical protein
MSPNDEFANFELFPNLINVGQPSQIKYGYIRQGLVEGRRRQSLGLFQQRGIQLPRLPRRARRHAEEAPQPGFRCGR